MEMRNLKKAIEFLCRHTGIRQSELIKKSGLSKNTIIRINERNPTLYVLDVIAETLGVKTQKLLDLSEELA